MHAASLEHFRLAKEKLDEAIREAVTEFQKATADCKLVDVEIIMNGWEDGMPYEGNGTIDRVRVTIEVI